MGLFGAVRPDLPYTSFSTAGATGSVPPGSRSLRPCFLTLLLQPDPSFRKRRQYLPAPLALSFDELSQGKRRQSPLCLPEKPAQTLLRHHRIVMLSKEVLKLFGSTKEADGGLPHRRLCQFSGIARALPLNANLMKHGIPCIKPASLYGPTEFFEGRAGDSPE